MLAPTALAPTLGAPTAVPAAAPTSVSASAPPTAVSTAPVPPTAGNAGRSSSPAGRFAMTEAELDDLARRLTDPLLRRLRHEVLVDRERLGLRIDRGWQG